MVQMQTAISTVHVIKLLHRKPLLSLHCEKYRALKPCLTCTIEHLIKSVAFIPSGKELPGNVWKVAGRSKTHRAKAQQRLLILREAQAWLDPPVGRRRTFPQAPSIKRSLPLCGCEVRQLHCTRQGRTRPGWREGQPRGLWEEPHPDLSVEEDQQRCHRSLPPGPQSKLGLAG